MKTAPTPTNEESRLKDLFDLTILDTEAEKQFDDLVSLASEITGCPVSLISLIDKDRQWFKAKQGVDLEQTPRDISFCGHVVAEENDDLFVVENALFDDRFFDNPMVTGESKVRFYAGQPLVTKAGFKVGTLCVIDNEPRKLSKKQMKFLKIISNQVVSLLELRKEVVYEKSESLKKIAYVSSMSHELRTPLTALPGYIEVLNDEVSDEEREKYGSYLDALKSNSKHLLDVVGNVLDFSKLEVDKVDIRKKIFSTDALINQLEGMFRLETDRKKIKFEILSHELPPFIETDSTLLKQIIINLVSNAVKFTKKGFVKTHISYDKENQVFGVKVEDSGPGISKNDRERIFSPFGQALEGTTRMPGTGLGLNISKKLAELLGGELTLAKTKLGGGSTFETWVRAKEITPEKKVEPSGESKNYADLKFTAKKILIVDDSYDNRFLLSHFLKDSGVKFDEATNGKDALSLASKNIYDYIFLDMQLPDMSGFEVFGAFDFKYKPAPGVVAFTASSTAEEKQKCLDGGFRAFLSKPFSREDVLSLFQN